ncbi:MAG: sigma-70 family RNA polymerase sigma factor [Chloroflexi bacterium]|jgi:RNA polymerase primary sigma factor|nr:sigma-70 family RNA polymerase sigma factor [Chloroflexota bacterium]
MRTTIDDQILESLDNSDSKYSALGKLIELGRTQGFVTYDEILRHFPDVEQDVSQLEEVFASLLNAQIPYIDNDDLELPDDEELDSDIKDERIPKVNQEDRLANIDTKDLLGLYFKDAAHVPLLTGEQELRLAKQIERGRKARRKLAKGDITPEERVKLYTYISGEWEAVEHLITANTRLVISVAKKHMGRGVPFIDLIQEGNIGLMRAAKKFDYKRGYKFSTYATWWIRQAVTRAIADQGRTIRIPVHMGDQISRLFRTQHKLKQDLERDPTIEELANELAIPPDKVRYMFQVARRPLSLEMPTTIEGDAVLGDFIEDEETPSPDETTTHQILREQLEEVMEELPAREARILRLRYGIPDGKSHTLQEVGNKVGVSRERVRQIEAQALRRLRRPGVRRKLQDFLGAVQSSTNT